VYRIKKIKIMAKAQQRAVESLVVVVMMMMIIIIIMTNRRATLDELPSTPVLNAAQLF
jgi:hypothetical protein